MYNQDFNLPGCCGKYFMLGIIKVHEDLAERHPLNVELVTARLLSRGRCLSIRSYRSHRRDAGGFTARNVIGH